MPTELELYLAELVYQLSKKNIELQKDQKSEWGMTKDEYIQVLLTGGFPPPDGVKYNSYESYLKSPRWRLLREQVAFIWSNRCALCYQEFSKEYHVHHRCYDRLGKEDQTDVLPLCPECHKLFHDNRKVVPK